MGLLYVKNWHPELIPFLTLVTGFVTIFGLIRIGEIIKFNLKIDIKNYWQSLINLILGIFTFSLSIQLLSFFKLNNQISFRTFFILLMILGLQKIYKTKFTLPKVNRKSLIPIIILISIFFIRIFISIIPTTKIDELHYHMLLPLRLISESGLNYYLLPWEGAIWPQMHYQFIGAPFYTLGIPDTPNLISIGIFIVFLKTLFDLVNYRIQNRELSLWFLVFTSSGLHSLVDLTTNASNSLLLVSGASLFLILCDPEKFIPSKNLKSFSLIFGLLSLGLITSKISMMPIFLIQILIFIRIIKKSWGYPSILKSLIYLAIPFFIFYCPIIFYTWIKSGSPFGPLLSSFFNNKEDIDPLFRAASGEIGNRGGISSFAFLALTKWSPFIWISWILMAHKEIKLRTKIVFFTVLTIQSLLIFDILPDLPRHYGGLQYIGILLVFIELLPQIFQKFRIISLLFFLFSSIPWLCLDIYYSYPLISKAFFNSEQFKEDYIPFYKDFLKLDNLLEKDSQLLVIGTRINTFHSPRKIYHYQKSVSIPNYGIKTKDKPTYLFLVGYKKDISQNFGQLIHSNENANQFCYRVPKKLCAKNRLEVYKINNFKNLNDIF